MKVQVICGQVQDLPLQCLLWDPVTNGVKVIPDPEAQGLPLQCLFFDSIPKIFI